MPPEQVDHLRLVATRYPSALSLSKYAQSAALNGRREDAQWAMRVICSQNTAVACQAAIDRWAKLIAEGHLEMAGIVGPQLLPQSASRRQPGSP
jgi:hypothetical protein